MRAPTPLRVLLLEDQEADAELEAAELRRAGFAPTGPRVETEAAFVAALDPALDVILADYDLPQFDVERALRLVQERGLDVPFIVVSGTIAEERAVAIMKEGASDYLLKDRLTRLGPAVRQALAQRALRREKAQAEARFQTLVEHAGDIIAMVDADGTLGYVSPALERVLGYQPQQVLGSPLTTLAHPEDVSVVGDVVEVTLTQPGQLLGGEFRLRHHDGSWRWMEAIVTAPAAGAALRSGVIVIARDVTDRRHLEELRRAALEHAALLAAERGAARKLEELAGLRADFTAMVAHELGSRSAAIRRYTDVLALDPLSPIQDEALASILAEVVSLQTLIADAHVAATVDRDDFAVYPRPVPVATLLAEAISFAATLPGNHPLVTDIAASCEVRADPERIGQVLRNLLGNAAKYSPDGSSITVRAIDQGARVRIDVADRGFGIDPADLARIFDKFQRGRDEAVRGIPGTGLGLYLSRRIVQVHGSELTVSSTPGAGSTFAFALAVVRELGS